MRLFVTTEGLSVAREEIQGLSIKTWGYEKEIAKGKGAGNREKGGKPRGHVQDAKWRREVKEKGTGSHGNALRGQ